MIARTKLSGAKEVGGYFRRYSEADDWRFERGFIEGRPAILVYDPQKLSSDPSYFVLIEWDKDQVCKIRDFRYARYVMDDTDFSTA